MNRNTKNILLIAAFVIILGAAYLAYSGLSSRYRPETNLPSASQDPVGAGSSGAEEGSSSSAINAPDFTVYDADGNAVRFSDLKGEPVVLNFWASWCYYCKQEMPDFQEVYDKEKDQVRFLFINWTDGSRETQEMGEAFLKENGYDFPAYYDLNQEAVSAYGLTGIPATVFIRSDGTVAGGQLSAMNGDTLQKGIDSIKE